MLPEIAPHRIPTTFKTASLASKKPQWTVSGPASMCGISCDLCNEYLQSKFGKDRGQDYRNFMRTPEQIITLRGLLLREHLNYPVVVSRPVQRTGIINSHALLGGLHHHYVRVYVFDTHRYAYLHSRVGTNFFGRLKNAAAANRRMSVPKCPI